MKSVGIKIYLPSRLVETLYAECAQRASRLTPASRSDVIRELIVEGLERRGALSPPK